MDGEMGSDALLPCPFCGSEVEGPFPADRKRDYFTIRCGNPACFADIGAPTVEAAAAAWNRRAPLPRLPEPQGDEIESLY